MKRLILTLAIAALPMGAMADMAQDLNKFEAYIDGAGRSGTICGRMLTMGMPAKKQCDMHRTFENKLQNLLKSYDDQGKLDEFTAYINDNLDYMGRHFYKRYLKANATLEALR